jgi:hypothetical protein
VLTHPPPRSIFPADSRRLNRARGRRCTAYAPAPIAPSEPSRVICST